MEGGFFFIDNFLLLQYHLQIQDSEELSFMSFIIVSLLLKIISLNFDIFLQRNIRMGFHQTILCSWNSKFICISMCKTNNYHKNNFEPVTIYTPTSHNQTQQVCQNMYYFITLRDRSIYTNI
jgi:hypothetical protein